MPLCTSSKSIAAMSAYRRIVHTKVDFALIQKEALFVGHGDILPDGGVLVTMNPSTPEEEQKHLGSAAANLPPQATRLDISGGFLLYEELEDAAGNSINAAAAEYEAHNERLLHNSNQRPNSSKVLRRKTHSAYSKQFSFAGGPDTNSFNRNLDLNAVTTLSLANDKEYNDRMLTLGRRLASAAKHTTEKQTQAAVTLDRYKLSIQELYGKICYLHKRFYNVLFSQYFFLLLFLFSPLPHSADVKPQPGVVPNSSGLANTVNPMNSLPANISKKTANEGPAPMLGGDNVPNKSKSKSKSKLTLEEKKLVLVKGIFKIDPRLSFAPDWM